MVGVKNEARKQRRECLWGGTSLPRPVGDCDPAYPTVCIPPPPPDLDCGEIGHTNFQVLPPDPQGFDRDRDRM